MSFWNQLKCEVDLKTYLSRFILILRSVVEQAADRSKCCRHSGPPVLAVHREVDEEVGRTGKREGEVAKVGDFGNPAWPRDRFWAEILQKVRF